MEWAHGAVRSECLGICSVFQGVSHNMWESIHHVKPREYGSGASPPPPIFGFKLSHILGVCFRMFKTVTKKFDFYIRLIVFYKARYPSSLLRETYIIASNATILGDGIYCPLRTSKLITIEKSDFVWLQRKSERWYIFSSIFDSMLNLFERI